MSSRPYILAETNWKLVKQTDYDLAVLPWGATEAHNYHLSYSTDVVECDYIAAEAARYAWERGTKVIVLPTVPFGVNTGQLDIKLDINMNPSTQASLLRDVVDSLSRQGFRKLVIMNGHGGNDFRQMIREVQTGYPQMFICTLNWYKILDPTEYFEESGDHAGELETSIMLHIAPELVLPLAEAGAGASRKFKLRGLREGWVWAQRQWSQATVDTGVGDPKKATAEKGEKYLKELTEKIGGFFIELGGSEVGDMYEELTGKSRE